MRRTRGWRTEGCRRRDERNQVFKESEGFQGDRDEE